MTEDFNSAKVRLNGAVDESEGALKVEIKQELLQQFKCATKHTEDVRNYVVSRGTIAIANIIIARQNCTTTMQLHKSTSASRLLPGQLSELTTMHPASGFKCLCRMFLKYIYVYKQCKSMQHCINSLMSLIIWCQYFRKKRKLNICRLRIMWSWHFDHIWLYGYIHHCDLLLSACNCFWNIKWEKCAIVFFGS